MSENEKKLNLGEPINEEQLDAVAGGDIGAQWTPYRSDQCWFVADSMPREDGRTKCKSHCKGNFEPGGVKPIGPLDVGDWYICSCWGTNNCIDRWHKHCGKPARTNWE